METSKGLNKSAAIGNINEFRDAIRQRKIEDRDKCRMSLLNRIRYVQDSPIVRDISEEKFVEMVNCLKKRSKINSEILQVIMNSVYENPKCGVLFFKVDGALQGLLRVLSGTDDEYQLLSARIICNLALQNDRKLSLKLLNATNSYLFAHLDGKNNYIKEACAIALGNFCGHGLKQVKLILAQGFFPRMTKLLINTTDEALESAIIFAIMHVVAQGFFILGPSEFQDVLQSILPAFNRGIEPLRLSYLMSLLSAHDSCQDTMINEGIHIKALVYLSECLGKGENEAVYHLRVLNNLLAKRPLEVTAQLLENHEKRFRECVKLMLGSKDKKFLLVECLGLVGIFLNSPEENLIQFGVNLLKENQDVVAEYVSSKIRIRGFVEGMYSDDLSIEVEFEESV